MKQIDQLLIRSFIGPFIVTFGIATFTLLMQVLWVYIPSIAGRGIGFFIILELLAYKCVGLVPLALPLAILISSVMVMGSMAEHYELPSIKSAGVSLPRIMAPIMVFGMVAAGVSYFCADYVIPAANKQFARRMFDIREKKPTLSLEEGTFNHDFDRFAIRIGEKDDDGRHIEDVLIYDMTQGGSGQINQISSDRGEMFFADNNRLFVMRLQEGAQYNEQPVSGTRARSSFPFVRTQFETYTKSFDMSAFSMRVTDADAFGHHRSMRTTWQLQDGADSILNEAALEKQNASNHVVEYLRLLERDTFVYFPYRIEQARLEAEEASEGVDSLAEHNRRQQQSNVRQARRSIGTANGSSPSINHAGMSTAQPSTARVVTRPQRQHRLIRAAEDWPGVEALVATFDQSGQARLRNRAEMGARSIVNQAESKIQVVPRHREESAKWMYEKHMKYSLAVACFLFVFIGAPMGAIVRKGGFGYPILVSVIFFVLFIILTIFCRKLAESFVLTGSAAGWVPCMVLAPIGLFLTYQAMRDAKLQLNIGLSKNSIQRFIDAMDALDKYWGKFLHWVRKK